MKTSEKEQRKRTRVPVRFDVIVFCEGKEFPVHSQNLSLKGMLCTFNEHLKPGQECHLVLNLTSEIKITVRGIIVRSEPKGTAIDFLQMDEDDFVHLRKIIEYNSGNPDQIDRELLVPAFTKL